MAISLPFSAFIIFLIHSFFISQANATKGFNSAAASTAFTTAPAGTLISNDNTALFSDAALLASILSNLGFEELSDSLATASASTAAPFLSSDSTATAAAACSSGPCTLFAPSDSSIFTCLSCSVPQIFREHIVPGLYTIDHLRSLSFGTKIETLSTGRCLTVTSSISIRNITDVKKIFISGLKITQPDLFNNGHIIIHGIQGYLVPLSPYSCDVTSPIDQEEDRVSGKRIFQDRASAFMQDAMDRFNNQEFKIWLTVAAAIVYIFMIKTNDLVIRIITIQIGYIMTVATGVRRGIGYIFGRFF